MMRFVDWLMGLNEPRPRSFTYPEEQIVRTTAELAINQAMPTALRLMAETFEEHGITDTKLGKVQGILKEDHPDLSIMVMDLRRALINMKNAENG